MRIGFSDLEALVRAVHGGGSKPTALLGRVKYLQRLSWPPGGGRGQGSRAGYGLAQVIGMMLAFELLELGLPPVRAVRLMRSSWDACQKGVILGWAASRGAEPVRLLALVPKNLEELGVAEDENRPSPDRLVAFDMDSLTEWAADAKSGSPALYIIDPRRIAATLRRELDALSIASNEDLDTAFQDLGVEVFGSTDVSGWRSAAADPAC